MRHVIAGFRREFGRWWVLGIVGFGAWCALGGVGFVLLVLFVAIGKPVP